MQPTDEQQAIIHEGRTGKGNILIDAGAGCAKTTTLIEVLKVIPQRSILFAAFNRGIAEEIGVRKPQIRGTAIVVQTMHAIGRQIVLKHLPQVRIDKSATEELVNAACDAVGRGAPFDVRRAAVRLVRCAKETLSLTEGWGPGGWPSSMLLTLGFDQNLFSPKLTPLQIERVITIARHAIVAGAIGNRSSIDFCDMVWLPLVLGLAPPSRYQAIFVDEVQDASAPQIELLERLALPHTRFIVAGDAWQQIYGWRGSLGADVWARFTTPTSRRFPLTMTWRCSQAVVRAANELVPTLRAQPAAEEGGVMTCTLGELPTAIGQGLTDTIHTFVLSRSNAPLLDCALFLWRAGIKFKLNAGDSLLDPLFMVIDRELDSTGEVKFRESLFAWHKREAEKADKIGSTSRREQIDEQRSMLLAALRYAPPRNIKRLLQSILSDTKSGVLLSTVHKVKGLEAERVFLLKQTFARQCLHDKEDQDVDAIPQEELNIEYVAITRAITHLIWVELQDREKPALLTMLVGEIPHADLDGAFALTERAMLRAEEAGDAATADALTTRIDALIRRMRVG